MPGNDDGTVANRTIAICRICKRRDAIQNTTTNLFTHLECHHIDVRSKLCRSSSKSVVVKQSKQSTLHDSVNSVNKFVIINYSLPYCNTAIHCKHLVHNIQYVNLPYCYSSTPPTHTPMHTPTLHTHPHPPTPPHTHTPTHTPTHPPTHAYTHTPTHPHTHTPSHHREGSRDKN